MYRASRFRSAVRCALAIVARTAKLRHGAAVLVCHVSAADSSEDEA